MNDQLRNVLDFYGVTYTKYDKCDEIECNKFTPLGEDWYFVIPFDKNADNVEHFVSVLHDLYESFDEEEEFRLELECKDIPDYASLIADQKWKKRFLYTLYSTLEKVNKGLDFTANDNLKNVDVEFENKVNELMEHYWHGEYRHALDADLLGYGDKETFNIAFEAGIRCCLTAMTK